MLVCDFVLRYMRFFALRHDSTRLYAFLRFSGVLSVISVRSCAVLLDVVPFYVHLDLAPQFRAVLFQCLGLCALIY